jgi:hypothetical protein
MKEEALDIFYHPDFINRAKEFSENYDLIGIKMQGDVSSSKRSLRHSSTRICRFCSRAYPAVSFSNYSHLLPQLIGNKDLYSDFECDACNEKFSVYENDLAEFLGISRSITGMDGPSQALGFKAKKLSAKSRSFIGNNILIIAPEDLKTDGGKTIISYTKNPFVPANVYKALLKSSLSLLNEAEINKHYGYAIKYLDGEKVMQCGAFIDGYTLSFKIDIPLHTYLFQKRRKDDRIPTHLIIFNFQNHIIDYPIPLHNEDIPFYSGAFNVIHPPPYFFNQSIMESEVPTAYSRDLCSTEKVTDEEEHLTLTLSPESLKNTVKYDLEKDQIQKAEFDVAGIKYLILTKGNVTVDPKALSLFIKEQMA